MLKPFPVVRTKPVFKIKALDDQEKFKPLPAPTGTYPYHLVIDKVIPTISNQKMVFHMAGDTGGFQLPFIKHLVANEMAKQCEVFKGTDDCPSFMFHLGDVVYNFGQAKEYFSQFFEPFDTYPGPIFAISGNHDADVDPMDPENPASLKAFLKVFCDTQQRPIAFAGSSKRLSNIQPNIYFTLKTPLVNFICLYGNVPRFGTITDIQRDWFIQELIEAGSQKNDKALIICVHQSAYSADMNHGSSRRMQDFLQTSFETTNVYPAAIFSGHVHNYQRFTKTYANGTKVPFIVAGAGGYAELHKIAAVNDPDFPDADAAFDSVVLENYCDDEYGFLKIRIERNENQINLNGEFYTIYTSQRHQSSITLFDEFSLNMN
jgi:predicted phosphodiesterase